MIRRGRMVLAVAVAAAGLTAGPARAEPIVSLDPLQGRPSAVTDAAGTLHAVSAVEEGVLTADTIGYCRVPATGSGSRSRPAWRRASCP
jgi:hypothetical protein